MLRSDVNNDVEFSLIDSEYVARYYVDLPVSDFNLPAADVDGDSAITNINA